ncbi:MAG: permease [Candidatus Peribacteraceae bacterium]|nr:permease [Candidatus Peribacteraceae bacterium]MDD5742366.1 permease [Candidatus Peribacteraceae bacterium]
MNIFRPLTILADAVTYRVLGLAAETRLAAAVHFFIEDTLKIFLLLIVIIEAVTVIRTFIPPERIRSLLSRRGRLAGHVMAGGIGVITPFCTCSAIPLFLGFLEAGVPLGVTFTFLIASPMVNEVALALLLATFGLKVALLYIASGLTIAVLAGLAIGSLHLEHLVDRAVQDGNCGTGRKQMDTWPERLAFAGRYTRMILKRVWWIVLIGIGVGAWMHGYVPADFLGRFAGADRWYAVPFAVLIGIPLYANAAGVMPIVAVLAEKGVAMGTTLAFMMAVTGLSLPEFLILRRVMQTKLILLFAGVVGIGILFTGFLFNSVL